MNEKEAYLRDHKMPDNMGLKSDPESSACIKRVGGTTNHTAAISSNTNLVNRKRSQVPYEMDYPDPCGQGYGNNALNGNECVGQKPTNY